MATWLVNYKVLNKFYLLKLMILKRQGEDK